MTNLPRRAAQCLLLVLCVGDLWLCPHSKVEESFALQATHDLFYYGVTPAVTAAVDANRKEHEKQQQQGEPHQNSLPYDHLQYPGVVPRSFVGPLILAGGCHVVRFLLLPAAVDIAKHPLWVEFLARLLLGSAFVQGWYRLAGALDRQTKNKGVGTSLLVITALQFHMPFYGSRMLPNVFATVLCLHAYAEWMQGCIPRAARLLIVTTAVLRCDVILLLFTAGLSWMATRQLGIGQALRLGVVTGVVTLALTVPLDSLLWQRPVWPEGEVLFFNTILNKSSEWGVSAWHFYFTSSLPKAMVLTLLFVPLAFLRIPELLVAWEQSLLRRSSVVPTTTTLVVLDNQWMPILLPALGFVGLYSLLGHKETRFLFPVLPLFNLAAAIGLNRVVRAAFPIKKDKKPASGGVAKLCLAGCVGALLLTGVSSLCFVAVSRSNYPGGQALSRLSRHVVDEALKQRPETAEAVKPSSVHVLIDVAAGMSGVSLFGQKAATLEGQTVGVDWTFQKAGYEEENAAISRPSNSTTSPFAAFTHLLTEDETLGGDFFYQVAAIPGNPRLDWRNLRIQTSDSIFIRQRTDWIDD